MAQQENLSDKVKMQHRVLFAACFLGTLFAGTISTLMSVYLPSVVKELLDNAGDDRLNEISALINAIFIAGSAAGGFIGGIISDRAGRKPGLLFSIICYAVFTIATGYMTSWWGVVVCRCLSGFGLGAVLVTTNVYLIESWPVRTRTIMVGILSIAIPVGIFSAGLIDYFVTSWRDAFNVGFIPLVIALLAAPFLQESFTWKNARSGRHQIEAPRVFSVMNKSRLISGAVIFGTMLIGLWAIFSWLPTWITTLVPVGDGREERGMSMMMLGAGGLIGGFASGWLINALGARKSMIVCFAVCTFLSVILFKVNSSFSNMVYVQILVLALFFGASQGVLSVFIPSLFNVRIRGAATGFCFNAGRVLTAIAVLFVGVLVGELGGYSNALFIFSFVFLAGLLVTLISKEHPVDETTGVEQPADQATVTSQTVLHTS